MRHHPILVAACALTLAVSPGAAQRRGNPAAEWTLLGTREVTDRLDHDLIPVTSVKGEFQSIKLTVQRAPVDFHRVVVHYGNGRDEAIELRATIRAGGESRSIDLTGNERVIKSVEFWYDARTLRGRRARIRLFGHR